MYVPYDLHRSLWLCLAAKRSDVKENEWIRSPRSNIHTPCQYACPKKIDSRNQTARYQHADRCKWKPQTILCYWSHRPLLPPTLCITNIQDVQNCDISLISTGFDTRMRAKGWLTSVSTASSCRGSNAGPFPCKGNVITTTLHELFWYEYGLKIANISTHDQSSVIWMVMRLCWTSSSRW